MFTPRMCPRGHDFSVMCPLKKPQVTDCRTSPLPEAMLSVFGAFLVSRLICSLLVYIGHGRRTFLAPVMDGWEGIDHWWLNPWTTYDSRWYMQIATHGYDPNNTAFFPLYPWLLKLSDDNPVSMALCGVLLSLFALLVALWLVFRLTELEWGTRHAHAATWLLAFSPAAPFFGAIYTESLFLLLLSASFLATRQRRWWLGGFFGMLAALLRNPGLLIAGALLYEVLAARRTAARQVIAGAWLLPLGSFLAVQGYFWARFGSPLAGVSSQAYYLRELAWPWEPLLDDLNGLLTTGHGFIFYLTTATGLAFSLGGLLAAICGWRRFRGSYLLLIGGITLMNLCMMRQLPPHTISAIRYMGGLFPMAQVGAWILIDRLSNWPRARLLLIGLQLYLFAIFSYLFGLKQFLG